jgi:mono/diheme cytochrome c family protein
MTIARIGSLAVLALGLAAGVAFFAYAWAPAIPPISRPSAAGFDRNLVERGAALAAIGNCSACHTTLGGKIFAGGLALRTPFGTIYSTNITPDSETGIGSWSEAAFRRSMREGVDRAGRHLYPAFPYDHFTLLTDDDIAALYAYLMTREPVRATPHANALAFPFNIRWLLAGWKLVFLERGPYRPDSAHGTVWNRGAYLVAGVAHCGGCHTPRNVLGAERKFALLGGSEAEGWYAYALNRTSPAPVPWDKQALSFYLSNGWHEAHGVARGPMATVIADLRAASSEDVGAIAAYIASVIGEPAQAKSQQAQALLAQTRGSGPGTRPSAGDSQANPSAATPDDRGAAIYAAACASCHESRRPVPFGGLDLALSTAVNGPEPENIINVVLDGLPPAEGQRSPTMPGFAEALDDGQVADLLAYLRARFSNAPPWRDLERQVREKRSRRRPFGSWPSVIVAPRRLDIAQRATP